MSEFKEVPVGTRSNKRRKRILSIGINDAEYQVYYTTESGKLTRCPYYSAWTRMLNRCYSEKYHKIKPTYIGCSVSNEWRLFSNFREWMKTQDWQGKQLDKDILISGNKEYSAEACVFISNSINSLLISNQARRGIYPQGVSLCKKSGKYQAQCWDGGMNKTLGLFSTIDEAEAAYCEKKSQAILSKIEDKDLKLSAKVKAALKERAAEFLNRAENLGEIR